MWWGEIDAYVAERQAKGRLAPSSARVVRAVLRSLAQHSGVAPGDLAEQHVHAWLIQGDPRPATVKSRLTKARPFVRWMVRNGGMERDVTDGLEAPRIPDGLPRCLDPDQALAVLGACPDQRARLVVVLMLQLGLRVGEVAAITSGDIDYRRRVLHVRGKGGRGRVTRTEPITNEAWAELVAHGAGTSRWTGPLIRSQIDAARGVTAQHLSKLVVRWFTIAGVKHEPWDGMSAHACRHTTAQDLADGGAPPRVIQRALGHRDVRTQEVYLRRDPKDLRDAMEGRHYGKGNVVPLRWGRRSTDRPEQATG